MKETLEDAAERNCESITHPYCEREKSMFIKGAKWQSERMYSKEDLREAFKQGHNSARKGSYNQITEQEDFNKWFEQFKKK